MPMTVNAVKNPQVAKTENKNNYLKHATVNGAIVGAGAGAAGSLAAAFSMIPKALPKDAFIKGTIDNIQVPENTPKELLEQAADAIRENSDDMYNLYKKMVKMNADKMKRTIPKALLIGTAAAAAVGAGVGAAIHFIKKGKKSQTPQSK